MHGRSDDALVLRVRDHGEGHRLVDLLTREQGLVRTFAPAARRSRRRFGGALEPMTRLTVTWKERPGRDLVDLQEAAVQSVPTGLRGDLQRLALGTWVVDLARALVRDELPHPDLFEVTVAALERLEADRWSGWMRPAFALAALTAFGGQPRLDGCARCDRRPTAEESRFSPSGGGLLCGACEPRWLPGDLTLGRGTLRALEMLSAVGAHPEALDRASHLPEDDDALAGAEAAFDRFVEYLLGQPLASLAFLREVARPVAGPAENESETEEQH